MIKKNQNRCQKTNRYFFIVKIILTGFKKLFKYSHVLPELKTTSVKKQKFYRLIYTRSKHYVSTIFTNLINIKPSLPGTN